MRNILLWDEILAQLHSGEYGPAPTYAHSYTGAAEFGFTEITGFETPFRATQNPFLDLNVSWTEAEHNLLLMHDEGIITADVEHKSISHVRLTEKGRRVFELRDEGNRISQPVPHLAKQMSSIVSRFALPVFVIALGVIFVLDVV